MKQSNKNTAIYCRMAHENYEGIARQKQQLESYLQEKGISSYKVYSDNGFNGISMERPALTRLMREVERGHIGTLVITSISRLSRSLYGYGGIYNRLKLNNVELVVLESLSQEKLPFIENLNMVFDKMMKGGSVNGNS